MSRIRRRKPDLQPPMGRAVWPDFWTGGTGPRRELSHGERVGLAREHGGADIVTSFGLVLSLR